MKKRHFILLLLCQVISFVSFTQEYAIIKEKSPLVIGEKLTLKSKILSEDRILNIYLPNSYHTDTSKKYPIIYLLDGSINEDFIHIVGLVQFCSFPWINIIPESIVVGIGNVDRKRDFTFPTNNEDDKKNIPTFGGSQKFISFLQTELLPFMEFNYRTDSVNTIVGQSLGGLLATEILFKQANMFDNYIIVSPSLWWDSESLLNMEFNDLTEVNSIYVAVGAEGDEMEDLAFKLYGKFDSNNNKNYPKTHLSYFPDKSHADILHMAVYKAFETLGINH